MEKIIVMFLILFLTSYSNIEKNKKSVAVSAMLKVVRGASFYTDDTSIDFGILALEEGVVIDSVSGSGSKIYVNGDWKNDISPNGSKNSSDDDWNPSNSKISMKFPETVILKSDSGKEVEVRLNSW